MRVPGVFRRLSELSSDTSGGNRHDDRLDGSDLVLGEADFFGYAEVALHSGVATDRHRCREMNHQCHLRLEDGIVACRVIELSIGGALLFRHHSELQSVSVV